MYLKPGRRVFLSRMIALCLCAVPGIGSGRQAREGDKNRKEDTDADKEQDVFQPGGEVKSPKLTHYVEPEFSAKAKEAFVEGVVKISTVITADGVPSAFRVISGLNAEQDRTAIEALKKWKFQPGTKNGRPVKVRVTVEVEFHLL